MNTLASLSMCLIIGAATILATQAPRLAVKATVAMQWSADK